MSPLTTHIPKSKRLWHERGDNEDENSIQSSTIGIMQRKNNGMGRNESFLKARKAQSSCRNKWTMEQPHMPYLQMVRDSLPVAQEISLTIMLLALHRALLNGVDLFCEHGGCTVDEDIRHTAFVWIMFGITLAVMMFSKERNSDGNFSISPAYSGTDSAAEKKLVRYSKRILVRFGDLLLMVALLRLLSSLLRSLTASYSSDTVSNLVAMGLIVHLLACDYDYANGKCSRKRDLKNLRQIFKGGTMSLNGALLSTTLLASRLSSDFHTFAFVSLSIIAFAFYPESRSHIARHAKSSLASPCLLITSALCAAASMTIKDGEKRIFWSTLLLLCIIVPGVKFWLQRSKVVISGPWDIAKVSASDDRYDYETVGSKQSKKHD